MNRSSLYLILIAAFLVQLFFLDNIRISGVKPDLLLILVVFFAVFFGPGIGIEAGFVSGLLKDTYSLDIFGLNTVLLLSTGLLVGMLSPKLFKESKLTQVSLVFISSGLCMTIHCFASSLLLRATYVTLPEYIFGLILPSSIYTAALSLPVFLLLIKRYHLKDIAEYL